MGNLIRNILSQLALNTSDAILAGPLLTSLGLPPGTKLAASAVKAVIKGTAQTVALKAYDDIMERQLSEIEKTKVDRTFDVAEQTFWEYVEKEGDNKGYSFDENSVEYHYALEVAEGVLMQSMCEFERKKLDVLGRFYGRSLYFGNEQWYGMYQTLKMTDRLTFRQIVSIRLICDRFHGVDAELSITAPDACVEIMDLVNYGIWMTEGTYFGLNNTSPITLKELEPTEFAHKLYKDLMLEKLSEEDIVKTLSTLGIKPTQDKRDVLSPMDKETINNVIMNN